MIRVLMLGWEFPPVISGGLGTACHGITEGLAHQGAGITFVVPRLHGLPSTSAHVIPAFAQGNIPFTHTTPSSGALRFMPVDSLMQPYITTGDYCRAYKRTFSSALPWTVLDSQPHYGHDLFAETLRYSDRVETIARQEEFDIIHAHDWLTFMAGIRAKQICNKPLILHVHSLEFDRHGDQIDPGIYDLERKGLEQADHIIAVSHHTRIMLIQRYGIPSDRISVVHNAVSRRTVERHYHVSKKHAGKIVLFLGRITFQKGPDYFIEAASLVLQKMPEVTFVMAGTGDMLPRLIERVSQLRMGNRFHFTGFLQGEEVERIYALSDLYVMPSVSEPFGISPLEAMLYDVPVIISRQAGVTEVLRHALTVDFWDITGLANKILAVLKYPVLNREILRLCRQEMRHIRWDTAGEKIMDVYRTILG